jgi:radical SAM superfamily enzyme YgiQ (UPF0313 family)
MDILFINPNQMQPPVAPLAIDYLGQALERCGISFTVVDLCCDYPNDLDIPASFWSKCTLRPPSAILLTLRNLDDAFYSSQETFLPRYQRLIKKLRQVSEAPVILGGCGFSLAPENILAFLGADFGITGTAENDLIRLLKALNRQDQYLDLPGLVWRDGDAIRSNPPSTPVMDTDFFSSRNSVDNGYYFQQGGMVGLETKRGCAGSCRYCVDPIAKGRRIFTKPLTFLLKEIESLLEKGIMVFHLCDSEFNLPMEHAFEVCKALKEEGLSKRIRWYTYATPQGFNESLAFEMAEAGCVGINFGVDHCRPEILSSLGRQHRREDLERAAQAAHRAGLIFLFDLLLGGPGETRQTLQEITDLCRELQVPRVGTPVGVRIYPNTPLAEEMRKQGPFARNPNLCGTVEDNEDLLFPLFFVSAELGNGWEPYLASLVRGDPRFFFPLRDQQTSNYNYNANQVLIEAIRKGHRGAFWDILRRLQDGLPPLQVPEKT